MNTPPLRRHRRLFTFSVYYSGTKATIISTTTWINVAINYISGKFWLKAGKDLSKQEMRGEEMVFKNLYQSPKRRDPFIHSLEGMTAVILLM